MPVRLKRVTHSFPVWLGNCGRPRLRMVLVLHQQGPRPLADFRRNGGLRFRNARPPVRFGNFLRCSPWPKGAPTFAASARRR